MKAVILAGGRGERLRPITDTRPKPLVPVLARPVMDYCLSLLAHHGVTEAYVTTHYLASRIRHRYGEKAFGMRLHYLCEKEPMGTCGGVKRLETELSDPFIVMSGDALCDFNLSDALAFHQKKGADATVILSGVKSPLEYGVVLQDKAERISAFAEKPDWSETLSDQVNTGVYILSPAVLKLVPEGKPYDFARDLFPEMLRTGRSLYGYKDRGYWCDIGRISELYRCNMDLLQGKAKTYLEPLGKTCLGSDGEGLVFISDGARVEKGAVIRSGTVLSSGVHAAAGCAVSGSVVMENTEIEKGAVLQNAILCDTCRVGRDALIPDGTVLGAGSTVLAGALTTPRRKYPPASAIYPTTPFGREGLAFTEEGVKGAHRFGLDRQEAEKLGLALARAGYEKIGVLWDKAHGESAYFATVLSGGMVLGGACVQLLREGVYPMASYYASSGATPTVFVSARGGRGCFFVLGEDGFPLLRREVLRLSRLAEEQGQGKVGRIQIRTDLPEQYEAYLSRAMGEGRQVSVGFLGPFADSLVGAAIKAGCLAYHGAREKGLCLEVFGRELKVFLDGKRLADTEKARFFLLERRLEQGVRRFYLPKDAPRAFFEHVRARGGVAETIHLSHTASEEKRQRLLSLRERWLYDTPCLAARLLEAYRAMGDEAFREKMAAIPEIYITSLRYEPKEENKARLLALAKDWSDPKTGLHAGYYGLRIVSEASSFEAALDNAFAFREQIGKMEEKLGER